MRKTAFLFLFLLTIVSHSCSGEKENQSRDNYQSIDTVPLLIMQIQKCSRLYTTEFKIHKIVTHDDALRLRGSILNNDYDVRLPLGDRKIAIPIDATLKAYVDFSQFSEQQIQRLGNRITIILPDPKVMLTSSKVDQAHIKEYVSFARAHFSDAELSTYEQQGREAIIASIPELGIVATARESAAQLLIPLMEQMGFRQEDITITFSQSFDATDVRQLLDQTSVEK